MISLSAGTCMNSAHFTGFGIIQKEKTNSILDWSVNAEAGRQLSNDDRLWVDKWLIVAQNSHSSSNSAQRTALSTLELHKELFDYSNNI